MCLGCFLYLICFNDKGLYLGGINQTKIGLTMSKRARGQRNWDEPVGINLHINTEMKAGRGKINGKAYRVKDEGNGTYTVVGQHYTWLVIKATDGKLEVQETDCPTSKHDAFVLNAIRQQ